jgi:F-type H+-transporting ATPase subunit delta
MADWAIAHRYAQAYVNALEASRRLDAGLSELKLLADTYSASQDLRRFLGSPEIGTQEKWELLSKLLSELVGPEGMGLLSLLLRWDRVDHLLFIAKSAQAIAEERQGILRGKVITAHPISQSEVSVLAQALGKTLGKRLLLERTLDPAAIGGVRVTVGTLLLDGTVTSQLAQVREKLLATKIDGHST